MPVPTTPRTFCCPPPSPTPLFTIGGIDGKVLTINMRGSEPGTYSFTTVSPSPTSGEFLTTTVKVDSVKGTQAPSQDADVLVRRDVVADAEEKPPTPTPIQQEEARGSSSPSYSEIASKPPSTRTRTLQLNKCHGSNEHAVIESFFDRNTTFSNYGAKWGQKARKLADYWCSITEKRRQSFLDLAEKQNVGKSLQKRKDFIQKTDPGLLKLYWHLYFFWPSIEHATRTDLNTWHAQVVNSPPEFDCDVMSEM